MSDINEGKDINEWYYQNFLRKRGYVDSGSQKRVTEEEESPFNLKEELEKARKTPEELYEPLYEGAPPGVYKPAAYSRLFNEIIKNSPDPIAMEGRLNSAYYIAMMEGIPFEEAFDNYESIASAYYGEALAPKSWPKAIETTWKASVLSTEISKLAFKLGQKGGEDAEIEQQIRELESRMPQPDEIKRSLPVQALKAAANFLPSQLESIKSGTVGGALGLTAGAAAGGVLSVVTGGVGSVYIPTIAALGYRIGGNLAAGMKTYELETGALYYDLLKYEERTMNPDGTIKIERINPKVAWQVAQAYGAVAAATEVLPMDHFLKGLGNIAGLGKAIEKSSTSVASAANRSGLAREVVTKFLKTQKSALAEGALDVGLESFQEVIQEMASIVAEDYARDITNSEWGTSLSPISREEASKRIKQTLVDSVMGMGVLAGVKGGVRLMVSGTQTAKTAVEASKIEKAEEKIVGDYTLKPEDLENFRQRAKEPVPENIKIARSTILEGSEYAMHAVDSTTGKVNATVRYEFEPGKEDEPGIVRILGFKGGASPSVNVNLMTSLMKQFPGWEIEFNPKNANQAALKQYLTENNPRGVDAGIQWYSTGRGAPDVNTLKYMNERLKEVAPTWNEKERIAAVNVVNLWAQKLGMTGDQLADKAFAPGIFVSPEGRTLTPEQIERGASGVTTWRHVGESLKAVIDLAPKANVSTVLHESSHAVVNFMLEVRRGTIQVENRDQVLKLLDEMEAALGVENGNWNAPFKGWTGEGAPGNRSHWEALAYALEDYLTFGKPPKPELKNIFERFAIWILDIYNGLKAARVQISPELSAFFDRLFENSKEIFGEDFDALTETEVVQEMKKEGQEPVGEPPKEISEQKKKAEQTQRRQLTALERAKQMEAEGRSAEEIEAETGWKKIDGEWKAKREREWEEAPSIEAEKASKEAQKETIKRTNGTSEKAFPIERKEITYKANEAIQNTKWEKLPGKVVLRLLKDYGVTKEELEWTGLDRFLDTDEMITPAQVEDILKANKLELQPVSLDEEYQKRQNEKAISGGENYREHIVSLEDKVIAKIRLDDREDSINRKVLLLEEILKGEEGIPEP
jgi:hypothetical protein